MAASTVYQLSQATDEKSIEVMEALAKLGGFSGRKQTPIGPTMLMSGALLFLGAMQLIQLHTQKGLFNELASRTEGKVRITNVRSPLLFSTCRTRRAHAGA